MRILTSSTISALLFAGAANAYTIVSPLDASKQLNLAQACVYDKESKQYRLNVENLGCQAHGEGKTCQELPGSNAMMRNWLWKTYPGVFDKIARGTHSDFGLPEGQTCTGLGPPRGNDVVYNRCVVITCKNFDPSRVKPSSGEKPEPQQVEGGWTLRATPEDLAVKINKASPSTFAFTRNYETGGNTFSTTATLGYAISGHALAFSETDFRDPFTFTPFLSVNRVEDTRGKDVSNLSAGFGFNYVSWQDDLFDGTLHTFDISGELVTDEETDSLVLDGTFLYRPYPNLPDGYLDFFIDGVKMGPVRFLLEPTFRADLGRVFDPGNNLKLRTTDHYFRAGGTIRAVLFGDPTITGGTFFETLALSATYTNTHGFEGALDEFQRFEARLDYTFPNAKNFGIGLSYVNGDIATTLEEEERLQAEITLKF